MVQWGGSAFRVGWMRGSAERNDEKLVVCCAGLRVSCGVVGGPREVWSRLTVVYGSFRGHGGLSSFSPKKLGTH